MPLHVKKQEAKAAALPDKDMAESLAGGQAGLPADRAGLTADLPRRNRQQHSVSKTLLPVVIILLVGVVTFVGTTLYQNSNNKSLGAAKTTDTDWLEQNYTPEPEEQTPSQPEPTYVTKTFATVKDTGIGYLNVRATAATSGEKLGQLDIGAKVEVLEQETEWVQVKLPVAMNGKTQGWVSAQYVDITTESVMVEETGSM